MTVDPYAICPCGNGKKIKFCKCKDSLPELDRVMTMIEGRQVVPAIDKLNQVLAEHPDAAWALAIKGRLMLELREYDSLAENSERFVRLQPSNPLALAQRAAAELFRNEASKATLSLLEALTESARSVDSFVLDIASILAYSLANSGVYLTARAYVQLPLSAEGYEANQSAAMVYQELNSSQDINQLLKIIPTPLPRDEDAIWGERFDEAVGLLRSNQILLAESKLQSLARTVPREPCVLTGLLTCAVWRGDGNDQAACLRKLSECDQLTFDERAKFLALSWLVEPNRPAISLPTVRLEADVDNVDETIMAFSATSRFLKVGAEALRELAVLNDGIPPKAGFQLLDREPLAKEEALTVDNCPFALGLVVVFGKQTDRPGRVEAVGVRPHCQDQVVEAMTVAIGDSNWRKIPDGFVEVADAMSDPIPLFDSAMSQQNALKLQRDVAKKRSADSLAALPLPCFGGKKLAEIVDNPATLLVRTALVRLLENEEALTDYDDSILTAIRQRANVPALPPIRVKTIEEASSIDIADFSRVDVSAAETEALVVLFQRARIFGSAKLLQRASQRLTEIDLEDALKPAKISAYTALVEFATSSNDAMNLIEKAKTYAALHNIDQANLRILELTHRLISGDQAGFNTTLRSIADQYSNRPEVMARVQQLLMQAGIMRPDGSVRERSASSAATAPATSSAAASGSAIWTPGSGSATTAPASAGAAGGSKLWIPGMD